MLLSPLARPEPRAQLATRRNGQAAELSDGQEVESSAMAGSEHVQAACEAPREFGADEARTGGARYLAHSMLMSLGVWVDDTETPFSVPPA